MRGFQITLLLASLLIGWTLLPGCDNSGATGSVDGDDLVTDGDRDGDLDRLVFRDTSSGAGNAKEVFLNFAAVAIDSTIDWTSVSMSFKAIKLPRPMECSLHDAPTLTSNDSPSVVDIVGGTTALIEMHMPVNQDVCSFHYMMESVSTGFSATGTLEDGSLLTISTDLDGNLPFYPESGFFHWEENGYYNWLAELTLTTMLPERLLENLESDEDGNITLDNQYNSEFLPELNRAIIASFTLYEDLDEDGKPDGVRIGGGQPLPVEDGDSDGDTDSDLDGDIDFADGDDFPPDGDLDDDNEEQWEDLTDTLEGEIISVFFDGTYLFASAIDNDNKEDSGIFRSTPDTISWVDVTPTEDIVTNDKTATDFLLHNDQLYAAMQYNGLYRSSDHGDNWEKMSAGNGVTRVLAHPSNSQRLLGGTRTGQFYYSDNNGGDWTVVAGDGPGTGGAHCSAMIFDPADSDVLYAGSGRREFRISTNGGADWQDKSGAFNESAFITALAATSQAIYLFFSNGDIFSTDDQGASFSPLISDPDGVTGDVNDYIVTEDIMISGGMHLMFSDNGGQSFDTLPLPPDMDFMRSAYLIDDTVYLCGDGMHRINKWW